MLTSVSKVNEKSDVVVVDVNVVMLKLVLVIT